VSLSNVPRQALYTGNWYGYPGEPLSYWWQRWYLRNLFRGPIAVYGAKPDESSNVEPTFSPSFALSDWHEERIHVDARLQAIRKRRMKKDQIRILTVGSLDKNKNQQLAVKLIHKLITLGIPSTLDIVGSGSERENLSLLIDRLGLGEVAFLRGSLSHEEVRNQYRKADFVLQPSFTEGFSKVPVEAMAHGVIPLLMDSPVNFTIVGNGSRGQCFRQGDDNAIAEYIAHVIEMPDTLVNLILNGRSYTKSLTLESWREHIKQMLEKYWHIKLISHCPDEVVGGVQETAQVISSTFAEQA
jgi:glycosyltransferase involved in cell wall biosynthesis